MSARVWSAAELAERWGCSTDTVSQMFRDGVIFAFKGGGRWLVNDNVLVKYETGDLEVAS
jgi:hypothetical protein